MLKMLTDLKYPIFDLAGRYATCDLRDTIILAGAPRSGTTWLMELLRTLPGYKALMEPLWHKEARLHHGFSWRTCIPSGAHRPQQRAYLHKILTGRLGVSPAWKFEAGSRPLQLAEHAMRRKLVVKFIAAGRMLQWLCQQFDTRGTVLIIRHPCAVVASMLRQGGWEEERLHGKTRLQQALHGQEQELPDVLREQFAATLNRIDSRVEVLATMWCLDYYVPFHLHREAGYPWILTTYERLLEEGVIELERIMGGLDLALTPAMRAQFEVPSSTAWDPTRSEAQSQLSKWKERLTPDQIDDILRVVEDFGLDFYTDDISPDYDRLMRYQRDGVEAVASSRAA